MKTVTEIKGKYRDLIDCLAPDRSSYKSDVNKLVQDCREELHARYDALIGEIKEAGKDIVFTFKLEDATGMETYRMQNECIFDSDIYGVNSSHELMSILIINE